MGKRAVKPVDDNIITVEVITPQQQQLIELLLSGKSITDAAKIAGVSRRTACYWLHDEDSPFRREYDLQRIRQYSEFRERVSNIHHMALQALEDMLSPDAPPLLRFQALKMVYEAHIKDHAGMTFATPAATLVHDEATKQVNTRSQQHMNEIYLYDDQNQPRLTKD
jgi:hypothetical protein